MLAAATGHTFIVYVGTKKELRGDTVIALALLRRETDIQHCYTRLTGTECASVDHLKCLCSFIFQPVHSASVSAHDPHGFQTL